MKYDGRMKNMYLNMGKNGDVIKRIAKRLFVENLTNRGKSAATRRKICQRRRILSCRKMSDTLFTCHLIDCKPYSNCVSGEVIHRI